jgi:hypothetical protein
MMKYSIAILLFDVCNVGQAQKNVLTTDTTIAIPRLDFDTNGNLVIEASPTSYSGCRRCRWFAQIIIKAFCVFLGIGGDNSADKKGSTGND